MPTATETPQERLEQLPGYEAFAVFGKLYEELILESERLAKRINNLEGMQTALLRAIGRAGEQAAAAGNALFMDAHPDNERYLAELVARVKGGDDS